MNPYNWTHHVPAVEIPRPEVEQIAKKLLRGGSGVLLASRGMGKTIFLHQLRRELEKFPHVKVLLFPEPPAESLVRACFEQLARALEVPLEGVLRARDLVRPYLERSGLSNLILLFDEFDRYARPSQIPSEASPGRDFFNSLESMRREFPGVGILAVGSIGVYVFRDALGSSFLSRAESVRIRPFSRLEIEALAQPFADRGRPLSSEKLESLYIASGGHPALSTYGLEVLWDQEDGRTVSQIFADFQASNREFIRDFYISFGDPRLSEAPMRIWNLVKESSDGRLALSELRKACSTEGQVLRLDVRDGLDLLESAGLIKVLGSVRSDPVAIKPINSILSLPDTPSKSSLLRNRLCDDIRVLLARLHASSADFFRPGASGSGKQLVPESVFSAFFALGLELLGWQVDREAQQGAGRTDIQLRQVGLAEQAVVELKIWRPPSHRRVHDQISRYWTSRTKAGVVIMLTDRRVKDWATTYFDDCFARQSRIEATNEEAPAPIRAQIRARSTTVDGVKVDVDHFLLRLMRD